MCIRRGLSKDATSVGLQGCRPSFSAYRIRRVCVGHTSETVSSAALTATSQANDAVEACTQQSRKRDEDKVILDQFREFHVLKDLSHVGSCNASSIFS